ncbi:deoxyribose-phosphate aldolase [Rickettsiales bacterium LUAb2]
MFSKELVVSLMDLTSLNDNDNDTSIINFLTNANNPLGSVAAICIYAEFIQTAKPILPKNIALATVVNFPNPSISVASVIHEVKRAVYLGADEIDLVIPYQEYIEHSHSSIACELVKNCKHLLTDKVLKVIIESGELKTEKLIRKATADAIINGADFVKTSTGKTSIGATLEAAKFILEEIKSSKKTVGFKASGGIKTFNEAKDYLTLAKEICGEQFLTPKTFRFGVSSLLSNLLKNKSDISNY